MLRDDLASDLPIFLATEDFAEEVEIDSVKLPAQVIRSTREKSERLQETFEPLYGDFVTVYFETARFLAARGKVPHKGDRILIGGARFEVMETYDERGLTKAICGAHRQPRPRLGAFNS